MARVTTGRIIHLECCRLTWMRREFGIPAAATLATYAFNARARSADAKTLRFKNADYVPHDEPPSWASGRKIVKGRPRPMAEPAGATTKAAALASGVVGGQI